MGPLEDWTTGALRFHGNDQYAVLANETICRPVTLEAHGRSENLKRTVSGPELSSPQFCRSSFLLEAYFKTAPGATRGVLVQKAAETGWRLGVNSGGGVTLSLKTGAAVTELASQGVVNDGRWHHVMAEADRKAAVLNVYLDGKLDRSGRGISGEVSLENAADLYVGGTPEGGGLDGVLEFLRLARGTLADSKTTIEELYAWEFDGPFLRDFTGRKRPAGHSYAGAIEGP